MALVVLCSSSSGDGCYIRWSVASCEQVCWTELLPDPHTVAFTAETVQDKQAIKAIKLRKTHNHEKDQIKMTS